VSATEDEIVTVVLGRFDPLVGPGLADILRTDRRLQILASGLKDAELQDVLVRASPRVVVVDEVTAASCLLRLRAIAPATQVLVLAHHPTRADGLGVLAAGATCVAWNTSPGDLLDAVRRVAQGERMVVSADGERVHRRYPENAPSLTPRETDVLKHLSQGKSHAETARDLRIGIRTVHTYATQVYRKLNASSRRELIGMPLPDDSPKA
jgi:two-component system response regulator DesR